MFGRLTRNGKLSPRRSTTFSNLLVEKRESVRVSARVCECVSAFVEARATEITFDFSIMASFRLVPGSHQHPLEFAVFLYRFLIYVPVIRGATYVVLQLTGKISLLNTDVVCLYLFYHFRNENRRRTKQLDFPLRHFPRYVFFFRLLLCIASARLPRIVLFAPHWMCCFVFGIYFYAQWTVNAEHHTSFIFSLYLVYVLLHHFNCFQTQATSRKN